jgi:hypothetical protein
VSPTQKRDKKRTTTTTSSSSIALIDCQMSATVVQMTSTRTRVGQSTEKQEKNAPRGINGIFALMYHNLGTQGTGNGEGDESREYVLSHHRPSLDRTGDPAVVVRRSSINQERPPHMANLISPTGPERRCWSLLELWQCRTAFLRLLRRHTSVCVVPYVTGIDLVLRPPGIYQPGSHVRYPDGNWG